mgnify:CR=1 FL=1
MGKLNIGLIATIVPLIIVGIGLIGWVLSLRSDVTTAVEQLENWAKKNRGELICALLTLVRAWIVAGKPSGTKTLGSYESWAAVMGGILGVVGIKGFLEDRERVYAAAEQEAADWLAFCNKWWDKFQDRPVGSDLLFGLVRRHRLILDVWGGRDDHSAKTRFGIALGKMRDRVSVGIVSPRPSPTPTEGRHATNCPICGGCGGFYNPSFVVQRRRLR